MCYNKFMGSNTVIKTILDRDISVFQTSETELAIKAVQDAAKRDTANLTVEKNSFPLRPSSALKGMRDLYYGLVNYYKPGTIPTTDIEGRSCMLLSLGHVIEKHLVEHIRKTYQVTHTAQKVEYGVISSPMGVIVLGGELDFIIQLPSGEKVLGDSKSSAAFPFKKNEAKDEHVAQLNLYMHSQWARDNNINRAWIWYYCKDNSELKIFEFYYDAELAKRTIARFQKVYDMYQAGTIPNREHILGVSWQASYSPYRDFDWKEYEMVSGSPRNVISLNDAQSAKLPSDKKGLLEHVIRYYGPDILLTSDGRRIQAFKKGSQMFLDVTDADGFSS